MTRMVVDIIGAGLAGSECALALADRGVNVRLHEMRPGKMTPAHRSDQFAELVCSNSLKSMSQTSAAGVLKHEVDALGGNLLNLARQAAVPAGGSLAVDRTIFSRLVGEQIARRDNIQVIREEVTEVPREGTVVIAAGPLCSETLARDLLGFVGTGSLSFYDAAAPIVDASTLDMDVLFAQSRYDKGQSADYLNAPMDKEQYEAFASALIGAERVVLRDFERRELFQACQPAEEVARTGLDSLRFGALKPVGIINPKTGKRPWAVVQLRAENNEGTAYNLVGFQTNLTFPEQRRVFRMIPGLEHAEFFRYGVMHRNTFVDAPRCLDATLAVRSDPRVRLAGQITGTEGYVEAMATGLFCALATYAQLTGKTLEPLPKTTALGSLLAYASDPETQDYQPSHVNFGLVPAIDPASLGRRKLGKQERYQAYADRAGQALVEWLDRNAEAAGI